MLRTEIHAKEREGGVPFPVRQWLPLETCERLGCVEGEWEELHLRVGRDASVTVGGENRRVNVRLSREEMDALILRLCDGSLYAHRESINQGFLTLEGGIRVGLCGHAFLERESGRAELWAVRDIDALCIRFPHAMRWVGGELIPLIRQGFPRGTLLYAPPGVGKTTLLRSLASRVSRGEGALRTAIVDSRCEIDDAGFDAACQICVLSGYPKGLGIEIAVRSMNAQIIFCDEIGNPEEAAALMSVANNGVPVIATAHAADIEQLLTRPGLDTLHRAGVFAYYVGLARRRGAREFDYRITRSEEL